MFNRILVPLDGSELAETALSIAAKLAHPTKTTLIIAKFVELELMVPTPLGQVPVFIEHHGSQQLESSMAYLKEIEARPLMADTHVECIAKTGNPSEKILELIEEKEIDLVVMTTHGHRGVMKWALGSVTERVLRHTPCPVLVIRPETDGIQHILAPLDGSKLAEQALPFAIELAKRFEANLTLQYVNEEITLIDRMTVDMLNQYEPGLAESVRAVFARDGEKYLQTIVESIEEDVHVNIWMDSGHPAHRITEAANNGVFDAVVMSTHGRTGIQRWVYGSVMEKVLRSIDIPILVVRPEKENESV